MTRNLADMRSSVAPTALRAPAGPHASLFGGSTSPSPPGLVARDRELSELERALGQCRLGGSTLVVLRGEPGTGKSALLTTIASRARDFEVIRLRASRGSESSAEWPAALVELLERAEHADPESLRHEVAAAIPRLAMVEGVPLLLSIDDAELLPNAFLQALVDACEGGLVEHPTLVLLAIGDVPHADGVSLAVAPLSLCRLGGLTQEQSGLLLERVLGRTPRPSVVRALVHAAGGNPEVLIRVGSALDDEVLRGWRPLPDPILLDGPHQRAFGSCLDDLPPSTRTALAAAAAGRIPLKVLEAALGELELDVSCYEPAVERGIVHLQRNRIAFAHPLVRAAAYGSAPEEVRARAHEALAHAFAAAGLVEAAASHARRAGAPATSVLGLYGQAVRVALDRADLAGAARHQEAMADVGGSDEAVLQHCTRAAAWWLSIGDVDRVEHCLERAAALGAPKELQGSLVYWRCRARMANEVDQHIANELVAAADLAERDASGGVALMLGEAAVCLLVAGEAGRADEVARRAVEAGDGGGFPEAFAVAVAASVRVLGRLGDDGGDRLRPATSFLTSEPDALPLSPLFALVAGAALLEQSGPNAARTWAAWLERTASSTGNVVLLPVSQLVGAHVALRCGDVEEAVALATAAADGAASHGQRVVVVRALLALLEAQSLRGEYQPAFVTASRLFADASDSERSLRAVAYRALAELELQRSRIPSALSWLKAAEFEVTAHDAHGTSVDPRRASWVATLGEVLVHDGRPGAVSPLVELASDAARLGAVEPAWAPALRAIVTDDLAAAEELCNAALRLARDEPALRARIEFCYAARLAAAGLHDRAARRLQAAAGAARDIGAAGWAGAFERALDRLEAAAPARPELAVLRGGGEEELAGPLPAHPAGAGERSTGGTSRLDPAARWEISMLGSFGVRHEDSLISMPTSLAATALKLVALRRRILVEELVEELWPESAPGVGMRRLRNVLWRVRVACGDILLREDKLILLSPEAVTDVEVFRRLAVQALDPATPEDKSAELVRAALSLYDGELLPMDRYADWAAATRESLSRLQVQLIELRVRHALGEERLHEALGLLDQLIESDPYEEANYLRVAELHEKAGNRRRALAALGRAERTLAELGIPPSPAMQQLSQRLS